MKKIFLVAISLVMMLCFSQIALSQTIWTKEYEGRIYSQIYNSVNLAFPNDSVKRQFSTCLVQKLKINLPLGLSSIPADSLTKLADKLAIVCKSEVNAIVLTKWSPEFEKAFRKNLYNMLKKSLPEDVKNKLCDCMISQYRKVYPRGMPKDIPIDIENKVLGVCYVEISKKNK